MSRFQLFLTIGFFLAIAAASGAGAAWAVVLPGPADINRIGTGQPPPSPPPSNEPVIKIPASPLTVTPAPAGAENIHFVLRGLHFEHVTVFSPQQLQDLYQPYIGQKVTLEVAWQIAGALTERYRQEGYFLSRAFVPAQEVTNGVLKIDAIEGFVGDVTLAGAAVPASSVISKAIEAIKADKPVRLQTLEGQILLLDDLPGLSFQAILAPAQDKGTAGIHLILTVAKTKGTTTLTVNNSGSRYIGPNQTSAAWSGSLLPLQQTDLSIQYAPVLTTLGGQLYAANATQKMLLTPTASLDFTAGYSNAVPGYLLKADNIASQSNNGGVGISYQLMRKREENLTARFSMDFRNSSIDIMNTNLSRDKIRAAQLGLSYDATDRWLGHNFIDVALRRGLPVLGSSNAADTDVSKPDVHPDFTKMTANYTRLQGLTKDWSTSLIVSGQETSGSVYSSEEFGYGGMAIGRAYDASEITGDDGIAGSLELHYLGLPQWHHTTLTPYVFYDIGKVWNLYPSSPAHISAASAGPGLNIQCACGLTGVFYIAEPLTKPIDTPIYSHNGKAPRYAFQLSYKF